MTGECAEFEARWGRTGGLCQATARPGTTSASWLPRPCCSTTKAKRETVRRRNDANNRKIHERRRVIGLMNSSLHALRLTHSTTSVALLMAWAWCARVLARRQYHNE